MNNANASVDIRVDSAIQLQVDTRASHTCSTAELRRDLAYIQRQDDEGITTMKPRSYVIFPLSMAAEYRQGNALVKEAFKTTAGQANYPPSLTVEREVGDRQVEMDCSPVTTTTTTKITPAYIESFSRWPAAHGDARDQQDLMEKTAR